jgi:NADH-quinone oxidoreductase subunit G
MIRACATPVAEGMSIITHDPELHQIRKTVIELILSTHPNSCLTCGRNGYCELQNLAAEYGIREQPYEQRLRDLPKDESTPSIVLNPEKCINCGRCAIVCQQLQGVWALEFVGRGEHTVIAPAANLLLDDSPCIKCGQCSAHCPVGAIFERDQTRNFLNAVRDPEKHVVVQVAPAVRVAIGEGFGVDPGGICTGKTYAALRRLGADAVFDTNFSADLTIMEEGSELVKRLLSRMDRLYGEVLFGYDPQLLYRKISDDDAGSPDKNLLRRQGECRSQEDLLGGYHAVYGEEV